MHKLLNLGCGTRFHRSWTNIDFSSSDKSVIAHNLLKGIQYNDNFFDVVYHSHVLEHFTKSDAKKFLLECFRVLKPNGHFSISDIVIEGQLPAAIKTAAEMYAGCVSGAINKEEYLQLIKGAKFENITVQKQKTIVIPDDILSQYLTAQEIRDFRSGDNNIQSITVYAEKANVQSCCSSDCCN